MTVAGVISTRNNRHGQGEWERTVARNGTQTGDESDLEAGVAHQARVLEVRAGKEHRRDKHANTDVLAMTHPGPHGPR